MTSIYYICRELGTPGTANFEQQVYHPSQQEWVTRSEQTRGDHYTSEASAKRRAKIIGGTVVRNHKYIGGFGNTSN